MKLQRTVGFLLLGLTCLSQAQPLTIELQRAEGQLISCKSNLKNLGTALEMWSMDHKGKYPSNLTQLSPTYLKTRPTCPAAGRDTYSATYTGAPARYAFACGGHFHAQIGQKPNHPAYDSVAGLVADPLPAAFAAADRDRDKTPQGALTRCKSNLKNIGTALEMWSTDHNGRYPAQMSQLLPRYLRSMPTCPATGRDTYSASLQSSGPKGPPDKYAFCCQGKNHEAVGVPANRPAYSSNEGILER